MAMTIDAPRSQAPAKKRTNWEKWGWIYMRVSGVLLLVLIFGHLASNLLFLDGGVHAINFGVVAGKLASPFWQIWDTLMLWLALIHGANGMRTITNDYVVNKVARRVLITALWLAAALLIVLGTLVVFTFDPCVAADPGATIFGTDVVCPA